MSRLPAVVASAIFFVVVGSVSLAGADPIRVTSGFVDAGGELDRPWHAEALQLMGPGLEIASSLEDEDADVRLARVPTVATGALADFSGVLIVRDQIGAVLNDSFGVLKAPFEMSFDASPTRLTCSTAGALTECTGTAPFTFDAQVSFTPLGGVPVMHRIVGGGTVEGKVFRFESSGEGGGVIYRFEASPVPEPASLSLFATGVILAGARARRRRRLS
jgi:hypothetical protein